MSKVEFKTEKGKRVYEMLLSLVFDTCAVVLDMKLAQATIMTAIDSGIVAENYAMKPGLFTMHDGVEIGDSGILAKKLLINVLPEITARHINDKVVEPFEAVKEFAKIVDKITYDLL